MKWATILILMALVLAGCASTYTSHQDNSRYTADQVIYVAKAKSPSCIPAGLTTSWASQYLGNHQWLITKSCLMPSGKVISITQWDFYEDTGNLIQR
jgi:hypothetical protein